MKTIATLLLSASLILSGIGTVSACTTMMMQDANGNAYEARTMEWGGALPDALNYFPVGILIQSVTPDGKPGLSFKTKHGFVAVSIKHLFANPKQVAVAEGANDQGLSLSLNAFFGASVPAVDSDDSKVLSALDFGAWALGNFQNVAQVKQALANKEVSIWPRSPWLETKRLPFILRSGTRRALESSWSSAMARSMCMTIRSA